MPIKIYYWMGPGTIKKGKIVGVIRYVDRTRKEGIIYHLTSRGILAYYIFGNDSSRRIGYLPRATEDHASGLDLPIERIFRVGKVNIRQPSSTKGLSKRVSFEGTTMDPDCLIHGGTAVGN